MRNKPLPGMMKHSPLTQKTHPVIPPTEEQSKKSKGTIEQGSLIRHGTWDRPELWKQSKKIHLKPKFKKSKKTLSKY